MAKDSNKAAVLERRRVELLHAVAHDDSEEHVWKRVQALKHAALAVAKQYNVRVRPFTKFEDNPEWQRVQSFWVELSPTAVVQLVRHWKPGPNYQTVLADCRGENEC